MFPARIAPSFVKCAQLPYYWCQPLLMQPITAMNLSTRSIQRKPRLGTFYKDVATIPRLPMLDIYRSCSSKKSPHDQSKEPKFPSKDEIERFAFKITVTVWDFTIRISQWLWGLIQKHIISHPQVQLYWKIFQEKLERARKDCS